jgi:hypothetical protein
MTRVSVGRLGRVTDEPHRSIVHLKPMQGLGLHDHRPRSRLARLPHQLHMRHHLEDERRGVGVSAPWRDVAFGMDSARARRAQCESGSAGSHLRR